jgi:glycolate oxidase
MKNSFHPLRPEHLDRLNEIVGASFTHTDSQNLSIYGRDETEDLHFQPEVVVKPADEKEISQIMRFASKERIPVTPRAGGTGLSGGALPVMGGILLSLERLNRILEIDPVNAMAVVEPGVITQVFHEEVEKLGLFYPPDPASRGSCHLGGNLAESAGGPRAVKYGVTKDYVCGLRAVLPSGEIIHHGGKLHKDATGYNLTQLLIGSEGTLAIITELTVKLLPFPRYRLTLLAPFDQLEKAVKAVNQIFLAKMTPSALEFMEQDAIQASENHLGKPYPHSDAAVHLLLEIDGQNKETVERETHQLGKILMDTGAHDVLMADSGEKQETLWSLRRAIGEAIRNISIYKEEDTVVPRNQLAPLIKGVKEICQKHQIRSICYGHAGDGNLHINILKEDMADEKWQAIQKTAIREIFELTVSLGGTISGEHGIGLSQKPFLPIAYNEAEISLMRAIKKAFDPQGILNPGKIF